MPSKNSEPNIFLVGHFEKEIQGLKLPTLRQVLKLFFFKHTVLGSTIRASATAVVEEVQTFWNRAEIRTIRIQHSISKLENVFHDWKKINKNRSRRSAAQQSKENNFTLQLKQLFDISLQNDIPLLLPLKHDFLLRRGFLPAVSEECTSVPNESVDMEKEDIEEVGERTEIDGTDDIKANENVGTPLDCEERQQIQEEDSDAFYESFSGVSVSSTESSQYESSTKLKRTISNFEDELEPLVVKRKKINIMTPKVVAALDRANLTPRKAMFLIAATAEALGHDINNVNLSRSTVHRKRKVTRKKIAHKLKTNSTLAKVLVLHWDGKLLPNNVGSGKFERLPIVVTGLGKEQLLGVPKIESGSGEHCTKAIIDTIKAWKVTDAVKALCFDTTASNTGRHKGTCALLEEQLNSNFLHLACRHHILELLLKSVVEVYWKGTNGPNMAIFQRFQQEWDEIDKDQYKIGIDDETLSKVLEERKQDLLLFISHQLEIIQPRGDYKEFLTLAYIFLGAVPPNGTSFKRPGANHHARWLAKAIYCLKMFLFRDQCFKNSRNTRDVNSLRQICAFIIIFYVKAWFMAPSAIRAPSNDLTLLQELSAYQNINPQISKAAMDKLKNHLWYLCPQLAALSLFDSSVSLDVKKKMVQAMLGREGCEGKGTRITLTKHECQSLMELDISDFVSKKSLGLFQQCNLPYDFLSTNPSTWNQHTSYKKCLTTFQHLQVVNDVAERGVALVEQYNGQLTKNEDDFQYLLQVVTNHRKLYPKCDKKSLSDPISNEPSD